MTSAPARTSAAAVNSPNPPDPPVRMMRLSARDGMRPRTALPRSGRARRRMAADVEVAEEVAVKNVEIPRALDHQRQVRRIDVVDQLLEKSGVADVEIAVRGHVFDAALPG